MPQTILLDIYKYDVQVTRLDIGLTRDEDTRRVLRKTISSWLQKPVMSASYQLATAGGAFNMQPWIDRYSEQPTSDAFADIAKSLQAAQKTGVTLGGVPIGVPILAYFPKTVPINISSLCAIGEGLAALYLISVEHQQATGLHRNIGICPDFILRDNQTGRWLLAEVKTTSRPNISQQLKVAALDILDVLAKTKLIRTGQYVAYVIGIVMQSLNSFQIHRLRIEEV
ncbi:hypothetical protein M1O47_02235 [Dehalococcoidia bacterium]|nr:hypothetical protein [Dehalococcoidia bacterium]MCL0058493.1 hypothetical protein [Dehalococcoidia bacterium]